MTRDEGREKKKAAPKSILFVFIKTNKYSFWSAQDNK